MELGTTLLILVGYVLALARVTHLITSDRVTNAFHNAVAKAFGPESEIVYFLNCPWCIGLWLALATAWVPTLLIGIPWGWWVVVALGANYVVARLEDHFDPPVTVVEQPPHQL